MWIDSWAVGLRARMTPDTDADSDRRANESLLLCRRASTGSVAAVRVTSPAMLSQRVAALRGDRFLCTSQGIPPTR